MRCKCYACGVRPAKALATRKNHYRNANTDPVFCSYKCAADYGLLQAGIAEPSPVWCERHGWQTIFEGDDCRGCAEESRVRRRLREAVENLDDITSAPYYCHECERELDHEKMVWLELNCRTGQWAEPTTEDWCGTDDSQGSFTFGQRCARKVLGHEPLQVQLLREARS